MLRKNPEMPFQILHCILQFPINSLVQLLRQTNARRLHLPMVRIDIIEKNRQALQFVPKFRRCRCIRNFRRMRHDVSIR